MICFSTVDGFVSWRDPKHGTWLGTALSFAFVMNPYEDLNRILTAASNIVNNKEGTRNHAKQTIVYEFIGWSKTLYFKSKGNK